MKKDMAIIETHKVSKFMIYDRMAKKGSSTYSPKSHSAPHFEGHYVEGMEEWASHYCFNLKEDGTYEVTTAVEPSMWLSPRNGSSSPTTSSLNVSSPLLQQNIMASPLMT